MYRYLSALLLFGSFLSSCDADQATEPGSAESEVRQALKSRLQAMIDVNIDALDVLLADDLSYTHSTGQLETKDQLLESLRAQSIRYLSISPTDVLVRLYDDAAVVTAVTAVRVHVGGQDRAASLRTTEVHRRKDKSWLLVAYQSTRMAEQQ